MFSEKSIPFLKKLSRQSDPAWLDAHMESYQKFLKQPTVAIVEALGERLQRRLPHFRFSARSISKARRSPDRVADQGLYKNFIACSMSPRKTSRFEMPPGFYLHIGVDEIFFGAGLYMPSGPQLRSLRTAIQAQPETLYRITQAKPFLRTYKALNSETMIRPPRGFSVAPKYQPLLMHKSFSVHCTFSQKQLCAKNFSEKVIAAADVALPLVQWLDASL